MRVRKFLFLFLVISLLTVISFAEAPVILAQPQNVYLPADTQFPTNVSFSVLASGDNLTYQWQSSLNNGETWGNNSFTTNTMSFNLASNAINGGRIYRCIISNTDGTVTSRVVTVSVGAYLLESLPQLLVWIQEIVNVIFDWVSMACFAIVSEPILLFCVGFLALGGCIAIVSRLLSRS